MLTEKAEILERWAEHYKDLLNKHTTTDPAFLESVPVLPQVTELDDLPLIGEVTKAINSLKNNKAPGPDAVPGEVLRQGGEPVARTLLAFVQACWRSGSAPQQWKDGDLVNIYKNKGERACCNNSRGISLLSCAGKVLARILLMRLLGGVAEAVLPESQCGFRKDRCTNDTIFTIRQIQEKCIEQQMSLYMVFIDLTKAFDTINRPALWEVLKCFGCPPRFLAVLKALHEGAQVRVVGDGTKSEPFNVCTGVRQGCVIAPVVFNLFLTAVMAAARSDIAPTDGVAISYRLDGSLFNLRSSMIRSSKVREERIIELQYADDAAVVSNSAEGLQRSLHVLSEWYARAGLSINTDKTEAMSVRHRGEEPPNFHIADAALRNIEDFRYLGSILNSKGNIDDEIHRRLGLASASFG